jgi:large subunit ribosomal protein L1
MTIHEKNKMNDGKKIRAAKKQIDPAIMYTLEDAIQALKGVSFTKFDETLEIAMKLGVDPKHSDQMVRGITTMPAGTGKISKVAVICKDEKMELAVNAGADRAGNADIIEEIKDGKVEYDVYIATPDMMGAVGAVSRILGPRGLMPNPKLGTVTVDIATAVQNAKSGQVEFKVEKAGIIHAGLGKLSFSASDLLKNANTLISAVIKAKPSGAKGTYLKAIYLSSTMGPSVKVGLTSISVQ